MSKVLSDWTKETVIETRKTKELEGIKCDKCGVFIEAKKEEPNTYYRVKLYENEFGSNRSMLTNQSDVCPDCLYDHIKNHFKNRGLASQVIVEKKEVLPINVVSDKYGNFDIK